LRRNMIIKSPVGRFPFTVTKVRLRTRTMRLEGRMGTWPTTVELRLAEIPALIPRLGPALVTLVGIVVVLAVFGLISVIAFAV